MATSSFDKSIVIKTDNAADAFIRAAEKDKSSRPLLSTQITFVSREQLVKKTGKKQ